MKKNGHGLAPFMEIEHGACARFLPPGNPWNSMGTAFIVETTDGSGTSTDGETHVSTTGAGRREHEMLYRKQHRTWNTRGRPTSRSPKGERECSVSGNPVGSTQTPTRNMSSTPCLSLRYVSPRGEYPSRFSWTYVYHACHGSRPALSFPTPLKPG